MVNCVFELKNSNNVRGMIAISRIILTTYRNRRNTNGAAGISELAIIFSFSFCVNGKCASEYSTYTFLQLMAATIITIWDYGSYNTRGHVQVLSDRQEWGAAKKSENIKRTRLSS